MSTPATSGTTRSTGERRVARLFGLQGDTWMRHANPVSVWTRFAVLPLIAASIWSRDWIGWWSLVPLVLSLVFMMVNPLLFPQPRSTRNWTSKSVLGERVWADRDTVELPEQFRASRVPAVAQAFRSSAWPCWPTGWCGTTCSRSWPGPCSRRSPRPGTSTGWCCCSST